MQSFMARMARLVVPGIPHHVTQRGNGRASTFFSEGDHALYRALLAEHCAAAGVEVWAWVLMPGHVRLILAPSGDDGLRAALARTHRRYSGHIHAREKRTVISGRERQTGWSLAPASPGPKPKTDTKGSQVHCHRNSRNSRKK